ncbi:MAG: vWA domain-containing protein [Desulfobacteraceae bacterium]
MVLILDGSASMWGELEDEKKIVIAKKRMMELVSELEDVNMGLIVYGHRRKADCDDIETMVPLQKGANTAIIQKIDSISLKGKKPITRSIELAAQQLETIEDEAGIILVSDGVETCKGDPCIFVKSLREKGIKFKLDVVGFDVN